MDYPELHTKQSFCEEYNLNTYKVVKNLTGISLFVVYTDDTRRIGEFNSNNVFDCSHRRYAGLFISEFGFYFKNKKVTPNHYLCRITKSSQEKQIGWALLYLESGTNEFIPLSISIGLGSVGLRRFVMIEFPHPWNKMFIDNGWERKKYPEFEKHKYSGRIQDTI